MRIHLIGIGGGTGAGKSTLARHLAERCGGGRVIDLDSYCLDRSGIAPEARSHLNYDEPAAIDVALLLEHLRRLAAGEPVDKPRYSFASHTRLGTETVAPAPLILIDGLFALWWAELRALCNLKVFVDAPPPVRLARRLRRDLLERGRTTESVLAQYVATVRPMHERYVEPTRAYADIVVTNVGALEECVVRVVVALQASARPTHAGCG